MAEQDKGSMPIQAIPHKQNFVKVPNRPIKPPLIKGSGELFKGTAAKGENIGDARELPIHQAGDMNAFKSVGGLQAMVALFSSLRQPLPNHI